MLKQNKKDKQDRHRWLLIGFLCLFGVCLVAQVRPTEQKTKATGTSTKSVADTSKTTKKQPENKKTKVYLLHADEGQADKLARPDVQVLIGNVKMRHDSMYMYCDSALIFEKTNSSLADWLFTQDRKAGEVTVIEDTDNSAYIVAYFISRSYDESNNTTIANQLLSQKYNELITGYTDNMSVNNIKNRIKMLSE